MLKFLIANQHLALRPSARVFNLPDSSGVFQLSRHEDKRTKDRSEKW